MFSIVLLQGSKYNKRIAVKLPVQKEYNFLP